MAKIISSASLKKRPFSSLDFSLRHEIQDRSARLSTLLQLCYTPVHGQSAHGPESESQTEIEHMNVSPLQASIGYDNNQPHERSDLHQGDPAALARVAA